MRRLVLLLVLVATAACRSPRAPGAPGSAGPAGEPVALDAGARAGPVRARIEGQRTFDEGALLEVIAEDLRDLERRSSPKAAADDAAFSLELHYRELGFPACRVDYRVDADPPTGLCIVLNVDEGPRVRIIRARFAGNASLPAKELLPFVLPAGKEPDSAEPFWFSASRVRRSVSAVQSHYRSQGFLDARVELVAPEAGRTEWTTEVELELRIEEGARWFLREVTLAGGIDEVDRRLARTAYIGRPLSPRTAGILRGLLRELYGRSGYPEAEIDAHIEELEPPAGRPGDARVSLRIAPGPRVRIAGVEIVGNERTDEERVIRALELKPGENFDVENERESVRNLYRLGVFSTVGIDLVGAGEERLVRVRVEERETRELYVEPGYGSYEGLRLGLGWRELNLAGTARRLDLTGTVSALAQRGELGLTDPRFQGSDISASASIFGDHREEPSFTSTSAGARLGFARSFDEEFDIKAGYEFSFSRLDATDVDDPAAEAEEYDVNISSISVSPRWDTRDSPFVPTEGALARPTLEWGDKVLGSEFDFLRLRWTLARLVRWREGTVLALSWRGGVIAPTGSIKTIPLQERFFNGGENTVRSFAEDELGPKDTSGSPIGGEAYNVLTAELRQALFGQLEGALFFDSGNVIEDYTDYGDFDGFRHALGVGVRYMLPVGPVRFDVGFNPDPRADEADYTSHLSVGFSF